MAESANGYPVLASQTTGPQPRLRDFHLPGVKRTLPCRDGSVGFLLVHLALWFDDEVEEIDVGYDDWGWSPRRISGSELWSNHASGTAIDLNADQHPMGEPAGKSFSYREIVRIHNRLSMYSGCIRWGGDYRTRPDAMHYEIDRPISAVVSKAQELVHTKRGRLICDANDGLRDLITR